MEKSKAMKICIAVLILALIGSGGLFADDDERMPMHTITADLGPLIFGLGMGIGLNQIPGGGSSGGWGIGAQYEFQPFRVFSVAGKFSYLTANTGISVESAGTAKLDFSSWSAELHPRWYPWGKTFFLDGMLGFANFTTKVNVESGAMGVDEKLEANLNFLKLGADLGWRIDFGKPGGFVFETSLGYAVGIGDKSNFRTSDSLREQLKQLNEMRPFIEMALGRSIPEITDNPAGMLNGFNDLLGNFLFVGGPKVTLAVGWRF